MISKEFQKYYDTISSNRNRSEVFTDFIDHSLYVLSAGMLIDEYTRLEKKYKKEELNYFIEMLHIVGKHSEGFRDSLGDLFIEYVSHGQNGQFFTPIYVSGFMAKILGTGELHSKDSVCDPCCGSGRMLLSTMKQFVEQEGESIRPQCYGADIDLICVKMCVINMILNSIPGEIEWMNTLTMEHWQSYHIELILIGGMWFPSLTVTGAENTSFIPMLKKELEENPELTEEIKKKVEVRQLALDF